MDIIYNPIFLAHDTGNHPENKSRLLSLGNLPETSIETGQEYLPLVHTKEYIAQVSDASAKSLPLDGDTLTSPKSFEVAYMAVGATILASQTGGLALVRPPGHHAHPDHAKGFCIFNNVAIAVQKLVNEGKRVLIFDFDGHLGDGTEEFFYKTNKVLYWSIHQFPAFPLGGSVSDIGQDEGKGYTVNVPLPPKSGDDLYLRAFQRLLPVADQFKPDVVAVSAGFDGHHLDPLLDLELTMPVYYQLGKLIREHFQNVFAVLEGGYNTDVFPKCVYNFLDGVNGKPIQHTEEPTESTILTMETFEIQLANLITNLSPYWQIAATV